MDSQVQASASEPTQPSNPVIAVRTWFEVHRKKLLYGGAAGVVLFGVFLVVLQQQAGKESEAGKALSDVRLPMGVGAADPDTADKLLQVASRYKGTKAAANALQLSAGLLYSEKDFAKAQERFNNVIQQYPESAWVPDAQLGVAACLEAQGKTDEAIKKYEDVRKRFATTQVIEDVKLALARLYENSNPTDSFKLYEDLMKGNPNSGKAQEAGMRQEDLVKRVPELAKLREPVVPPATQTPPIQITPITNRPGGSNRTISLTNLIRRATNAATGAATGAVGAVGAAGAPTLQVAPQPAAPAQGTAPAPAQPSTAPPK